MENAGIFYGHLEYFTFIWYILWSFVNVVVIGYIFPHFGILCQEISGNPGGHQSLLVRFAQVKIVLVWMTILKFSCISK
jgi:hypothetical protein